MPADSDQLARAMIARYTDQPDRMPDALRRRFAHAFGGEDVQLYALADLDAGMNLTADWVAVGPHHVGIAAGRGGGNGDGHPEIRVIERSAVREVRESAGLSCTTLRLLGEPGEPALATLRYTNRQRRAMGNVQFLLKEHVGQAEFAGRDPDKLYADALVQPIQEAQAAVEVRKFATLWRLLGYLRPYRRHLTTGMVAAAIATIMVLVPPALTGYLLDHVIAPFQGGKMERGAAIRIGLWLIAAIGGVYMFNSLFMWLRFRSLAMLGEYVARDLREDLYGHVQTLSLSYFSRKQTGSIISRVTSDTDRIWDFVAFGVVEVSLALVKLIGLGAVLIWLDWKLGLVMTLPVPILLWTIYRHGERMNRLFLRIWRKWSNMTDVLSDTIPGVRVVKAFNQERHETDRFAGRSGEVVTEATNIHREWTTFWPMLVMAMHALTLGVWLFAVPRMVATGAGGSVAPTLTVGEFVSFLLYMTMFAAPIETIGQMARMLNRATSSAHRIFEVLDTQPQIVDPPEPVRLEPVEGHVVLENVTFAYDGVRPVIKGISIDVTPGEMIGLVGPSGGGKTTLINLMSRFYEPTGGRILVDGVDLRDLDIGHFRRQIGMVLQDPYLFHGTIIDNIRYGLPGADLESAVEAAIAANAHDFICKLPHGYDTVVGERGHTLSGGERQRVSIARAILHNPRILFLDEATSSVDTETERKIQEALDRLVHGRTVFAIAHRLSTLTRATRLFVIEDGRVTEQGTHAELLAADGTYAKLHRLQRELHEMYAV